MFKPSTLLIAVLLSSTALWSGFVTGSMSVTNALIRFLVAVPVAAAMTFALRMIMDSYNKREDTTKQSVTLDETAGLGLDGTQTVR